MANNLLKTITSPAFDRRQDRRMRLHIRLLLSRESGLEPVETVTENISVGGFFCVTPALFQSGEEISCLLVFPRSYPSEYAQLYLEARATVVRVDPEPRNGDTVGMACRIESYNVVSYPAVRQFRVPSL